jgi:hypothetical protein
VDFWAQHKDFILKVLAGFGVFLVALIARGVVLGDDLERAESRGSTFASKVRRNDVVSPAKVSELNRAAEQLDAQTERLATEIGWDATDERALQRRLLERVLERIVEARDLPDDPKELAGRVQQSLAVNLNGAFGELRLRLREEMLDEAAERSVGVPEDGLGFGSLVSIEPVDLTKYLLQLELVSRVTHAALGMEIRRGGKTMTVAMNQIAEVRIDTQDETPPPIPGANPNLLREYVVRFRLRGNEVAVLELLNRLDDPKYGPRVPIRALKAERRERDLVDLELRLVAVAVQPDAAYTVSSEAKE